MDKDHKWFRLGKGERLTVDSPLLVRDKKKMVPMTAAYMARIDTKYAPFLGWGKATIHSWQRRIGTAAVGCGMYNIWRRSPSQCGIPRAIQYVTLFPVEKASISTLLAIASYKRMKLVHSEY